MAPPTIPNGGVLVTEDTSSSVKARLWGFSVNDAELKPAHKQFLDGLIAHLQKGGGAKGGWQIGLLGEASRSGSMSQNAALGVSRAGKVRQYLEGRLRGGTPVTFAAASAGEVLAWARGAKAGSEDAYDRAVDVIATVQSGAPSPGPAPKPAAAPPPPVGVFVHLWSDPPNKKPFLGANAIAHADGDPVYRVDSAANLENVFKELLKKNTFVAKLDFHTHGFPGGIALGSELLWALDDTTTKGGRHVVSLAHFRDKGYDQVFLAGAHVFFHGCNVADTAEGELFLAVFGSIFLRVRGGRVGGSTSTGYNYGIWKSKLIHWSGNTVYAQVEAGGDVTMDGARLLDPKRLHEWIDDARKGIAYLRDHSQGGDPAGVLVAADLLDEADKLLAARKPTIMDTYRAAKKCIEASRLLEQFADAMRLWQSAPDMPKPIDLIHDTSDD
jgi:hypothetical protein